ncbi:mercuric transport protein MerTP [Luteibaculum oceani]|uniref:Mercuric transport protein MerT n=1 Tax=Luteibaculum oceani TaxID=1294296 RepID=A0A5C6UYH8_9FLAO|nr:mercuric transport protein MerTP [Luteibaculum oceani]TXC78347.1 mercuric transport protein MerTP [Luteibaculum oceani]
MKTEKKLLGAGLLSAFAASLCCIAPVLALVAGSSSFATTFSWLEPLRPYLIVLTIGTLAFAWYQKFKPKKEDDCDCEPEEKGNFLQSTTFLGLVTIMAALMLAFPYYSNIFYPNKQDVNVTESTAYKTVEFSIAGMTCSGCEEHVNHEVQKLPGILSTETSYSKANSIIVFDPIKTNALEIEQAILKTGYEVNEKKHD